MKSPKQPRSWFLPIIIVIATFLAFFAFRDKTLVLDEISTINIVRDWHTMLQIMWQDEGNMWLYYLIMHVWLKLGTTELVLRSLSVIFGILTVPAIYALAEEIAGKTVARISSILLTVNLYFIFYAQMGRSYSLALLLVTCASYAYIKLMKGPSSKKYLVMYIIASTLAIYTYLLTGLIVAVQYISLITVPKKTPWKPMIITAIAIGIAMIPLILAPSFHGHQLDWLQKPKLVYLPMGFILLAGDSLIVSGLYGFIMLSLLLSVKKELLTQSWNRFILVWLGAWTMFPIVFGFLFSLVFKPIYEPESFNTVLPGFIILAAIGLEKLLNSHKWLFRVLLTLIVVFSLVRLGGWYSESLKMHVAIDNEEPRDWKELVEYIEDERKPNDAVILYAYYIRPPFEYYLSRYPIAERPHILEISSGTYALGGGTVLPEPDFKVLDGLSNRFDRVWLVSSYNDTYWLGREHQWLEVETELEKYFKVTRDVNFYEIRIQLFQKL